MEALFLEEFSLQDTLGQGAFGKVIRAVSIRSNELVAIKFEEVRPGRPQLLLAESDVLRALQGGPGIPRLHYSGRQGTSLYMILELLGPTLQSKFTQRNRDFSLKTVLQVADQSLDRIQFMHNKGFLHRDIKPQNFLFGLHKTANTLYVADFGLAKRYTAADSGMHIPYRENKPFAGTACYAALNTHLGVQQSRRDDLESLMFILVFLMKRTLPWQRKYSSRTDKHNAIRMQKLLLSPDELCSDLPRGFAKAFNYIRGLGFDEVPNYALLKTGFRLMAVENQVVMDSVFDWTVLVRTEDDFTEKRHRERSQNRRHSQNRPLVASTLPNTRRKKKRAHSLHPRADIGFLPSQPVRDLSENSSYNGSEERDESTLKTAKLPVINRARLPSEAMEGD